MVSRGYKSVFNFGGMPYDSQYADDKLYGIIEVQTVHGVVVETKKYRGISLS